ncbi:MAG TPA: gamma-glutamylcyclotransferase family protein [bacterium]
MKYFAYGSNMLEARLKHSSRAPSASCIGAGMLRGYRIRFHKIGKDGSGKCNAQATDNLDDVVYGVVYHIADRDTSVLDEKEDVPRGGYSRKQVDIVMLDDYSESPVDCYFANPKFIDDNLLPFEWYKALVIAGALEHDLPEEYVRLLREYPSIEDSDRERSQNALHLLGPWYTRFCPDS